MQRQGRRRFDVSSKIDFVLQFFSSARLPEKLGIEKSPVFD
jgi:hypothetical protein